MDQYFISHPRFGEELLACRFIAFLVHLVANGLTCGGRPCSPCKWRNCSFAVDPADWAIAAIGALMVVMVKPPPTAAADIGRIT